MNRKIKAIGIIVIVAIISNIFLCGCIKQSTPNSKQPTPKTDDSEITPERASSVVNATTQFAFDLYSEFKDKEENIFFSPYSMSVLLAMIYEGARGQTEEEMGSVLYFPEDNDTRRSDFVNIYTQINKKDKEYTLHTANALWAHENYQFLEEYLNLIEQYYGGKATNLDFIGETEKSRETINAWVEEQTSNKIKDLIQKGDIDQMTRLVLTNAIYFKSNWVKQFDENNTWEQDFKINSEKTVKVPMMSLTENFNYAETDELQILEMPYESEELSMHILLPKADNLDSIEASISLEKLNEWKNNFTEQEVYISIPKFKFETKYYMAETLKEMGMSTAFSSGADFSGMDGTNNLFISSVIHQAFIEVNEEGTEAAAATGGVMVISAPSISFYANHPFIFIIQDRESGNILFLGRVIDPTK